MDATLGALRTQVMGTFMGGLVRSLPRITPVEPNLCKKIRFRSNSLYAAPGDSCRVESFLQWL